MSTHPGALPLVAVVGRPNVGKSSLVNRILGRREAIVEATPGVTRDRKGFVAEWGGRHFEIVDTGGLEPGAEGIEARVGEQAQVAIEAADVVLLVVDAVSGPTEDDHLVADVLRKSDKPVLVVANKVDDPRDEPSAAEFYRLGLGDPYAVSALHGRGSGDLLEALGARLPDAEPPSEQWASLAIVGRPNVGKSSMLNRLVEQERAIVDATPGTTRDPVDSVMELPDGRELRIVDTAGMRRRTHIDDSLEYFSFLRSQRVLGRSDAALLVIDASEGVTALDQKIAEAIVDAGNACVIAFNKWDLVTTEEVDRERLERDFARRLRFLPWADTIRTSATRGRGMKRPIPAIEAAIASHRTRLPTSVVNRIVADAQTRRPHPRSNTGRQIRILYAVQASVAPPTFVLFSSGRLEASYMRFIENRIREVEAFRGSPLRIEVRVRSRPNL